ncbi:MAG: DNA cytosine methyltransferase [Sphingomonas sp.]|jgi:DNA (cytosine-5)-methyltransferase 1
MRLDPATTSKTSQSPNTFIDLFSGCGGLSLGLLMAGWNGLFCIEKSEDAFSTFKTNLCEAGGRYEFSWPKWLPCEAMTTSHLLENYRSQLESLKGGVDLIAGGPPCQGFSMAGLRSNDDPRNRLTEEYIEIVRLIEPKYLLLENVRGFQLPFAEDEMPYSQRVALQLASLGEFGYEVYSEVIDTSKFGVPQMRKRFIMLCIRKDQDSCGGNPLKILTENIRSFRDRRSINGHKIGVREAIGDLETFGGTLIDYPDDQRFKQILYDGSGPLTAFQQLMRAGVTQKFGPDSLRLPNHTPEIVARFSRILEECPRGRSLSPENREKFSTKKQCLTPLHPDMLARTVTTLPDDMIHYGEPRILTVRENARLQTFPDWFSFKGKYTTGGHRRKKECPRYTQVGNAVPPLLAEAIGETLLEIASYD